MLSTFIKAMVEESMTLSLMRLNKNILFKVPMKRQRKQEPETKEKKRKAGDISVPKNIYDSLAKRYPGASKSKLQKHLQANIKLLTDVYLDEQENHLWFWDLPEREAAMVVSRNNLLPAEPMTRMFQDIERDEEFKKTLNSVDAKAMTIFPQLMMECLTDVSLQEFKDAIDIVTQEYSLQICKKLRSMTQIALKLLSDNVLEDDRAKDYRNHETNVVVDIIRMFFGDTIGKEMAIARLEAILEFLG